MTCCRFYRIFALCLIGFLVCYGASACAETLRLESGRTLSGEIVETHEGYYVLKAADGLEIVVSRRRILRIDGETDTLSEERPQVQTEQFSAVPSFEVPAVRMSQEKEAFDRLVITREEVDIYLETYTRVLDQAYATRNQPMIRDVLLEGMRYFRYVRDEIDGFPQIDSLESLRKRMRAYLGEMIRMQGLVFRVVASENQDLQDEVDAADRDLADAVLRLDEEIRRISKEMVSPACGTDILDEGDAVIGRLQEQQDQYLQLIKETQQQLQETESLGGRTRDLLTTQEEVQGDVKAFLKQQPARDLQRSQKEYQYYLEAL